MIVYINRTVALAYFIRFQGYKKVQPPVSTVDEAWNKSQTIFGDVSVFDKVHS